MTEEHVGDAGLDPQEAALVHLACCMASRGREVVQDALEVAVQSCEPRAVEEMILQGYLFLGYPAALNTFAAWRRISGRPADPPTDWDPELWERRGAEVCRTVYAGQYENLRDNVRALHGDMEHWMVVEGYGKVLGRPGLELRIRELGIVALLAVQDAPHQLYSHMRGALHAGATSAELDAAMAMARPFMSPAAIQASEDVWTRVRTRKEGN